MSIIQSFDVELGTKFGRGGGGWMEAQRKPAVNHRMLTLRCWCGLCIRVSIVSSNQLERLKAQV